ncbi:hypothetical protein [Rheinheimera nanhaiensis]|uniref:Uncharacterized protein n=1 Tax=Rheinheimera nanhaiensis E407-8 TaxID=562729 RepID=I1DZG4_9GAMM|nr:hypothetical protein [Rheinheimera nanhaiensis]GAB59442.1 hypothetical protein RNAN_2445 [Rheinheimera nanhaiensis E407-8]
MLRFILNRMLLNLQKRYQYDVRYQQHILHTDLSAYIKFCGFQSMAAHQADVPPAALYAARIRAILAEDCGPCSQLVVDMALESGVPASLVQAIVERQLQLLPAQIALVMQFTEQVLTHQQQADALRQQICRLWGDKGLISLAFAISSYRVYPTLKYALGYGKSCSRIRLNDQSIAPKHAGGE